ncbi:MAG: thioredoxin family protein [Bacteroidetes Order II. Incertae sedis bacterium]|nr:thioredoxin family protein [Bacteroidetes Order II. bacterium]
MKKILFFAIFGVLALVNYFVISKEEVKAPPTQTANLAPQVPSEIKSELAIGAVMPLADHLMENVDGKTLSTKGVKGAKGTVVLFWCNTCPWVARYESRAISLTNLYKSKGFGFIAVNPNDPVAYPEEAIGFMKAKAQEKQYPFPYVADVGSTLARAYGAARTPHVFLFDATDKLVYVGGIDDNPQKEAEAKPYLKNALEAVLAGKMAPDTKTRAFGCTIKWQEKL